MINPYIRQRKERVQSFLKEIQSLSTQLSPEKLARLDYGDTVLLDRLLHSLRDRLVYLVHLQGSGCSRVLEACDILPVLEDE